MFVVRAEDKQKQDILDLLTSIRKLSGLKTAFIILEALKVYKQHLEKTK